MPEPPAALWIGGPPGIGGPLSIVSAYEPPLAQLQHHSLPPAPPHPLPEAACLLAQAADRHQRGSASAGSELDEEAADIHVDHLELDEQCDEEEEDVVGEEPEEVRVRRADTTESVLGSPNSPDQEGRDRMEQESESPRAPAQTLRRTRDVEIDFNFRLSSDNYR